MYMRPFERLPGFIECVLHLIDNEMGHLAVDISGQFDETRLDAGLFGFPGEVEGIDGDAMAAQARSRIKWHEAKRLSGCGVDHFPDVDAHPIAHEGHILNKTNVYHPERILKEFYHLRDARRADRNH